MIEHGLTRPLETGPPDKFVLVTDNPAAEPQRLRDMFDFLNEAHRRLGDNPPNMDFDKFRKLIETPDRRDSKKIQVPVRGVFHIRGQRRKQGEVCGQTEKIGRLRRIEPNPQPSRPASIPCFAADIFVLTCFCHFLIDED